VRVIFVGQRHRHDLERVARKKLPDPRIFLRLLASAPQDCVRSDHQNAPEVAVALF
jgi:hypothetical protein